MRAIMQDKSDFFKEQHHHCPQNSAANNHQREPPRLNNSPKEVQMFTQLSRSFTPSCKNLTLKHFKIPSCCVATYNSCLISSGYVFPWHDKKENERWPFFQMQPPNTPCRPSSTASELRWTSTASPSAPSTTPSSAPLPPSTRRRHPPDPSGPVSADRFILMSHTILHAYIKKHTQS